MKQLLATFEVEGKRFSVFGAYSLETIKFDEKDFTYPEFYDLSSTTILDGKPKNYKPSGSTFDGRSYDITDMISGFISDQMFGEKVYKKIYLEDKLTDLVDQYRKNTVAVKGNDIATYILYGHNLDLYKLEIVTTEYMYYSADDSILMFNAKDCQLISDNYFAEIGLWDSMEAIKVGKEKILWGNLPME